MDYGLGTSGRRSRGFVWLLEWMTLCELRYSSQSYKL